MTRIAYQGLAGAYSEAAIRRQFGDTVEPVACSTFDDLLAAVESAACDHGMLPIENAIAGSVHRAYELLMEVDLRITAEVILPIAHALLAAPGTTLADVQIVRSHPQALAQCARYLKRHGLAPEPASDTAGAAHDLAAHPSPGVAVIAAKPAAALTGLEAIDCGIEDHPYNSTRFFVLSCHDAPRTDRSKTSVVFTTPHRPGALHACLGEFASRGISLCKLESRPRTGRPWQYLFYLDFEGHCEDPPCERALAGLLRRSSFVKLLGSYPAALPD